MDLLHSSLGFTKILILVLPKNNASYLLGLFVVLMNFQLPRPEEEFDYYANSGQDDETSNNLLYPLEGLLYLLLKLNDLVINKWGSRS